MVDENFVVAQFSCKDYCTWSRNENSWFMNSRSSKCIFVSWFQLHVVPLHCALHCELRRVKCIRINYRSEIFQMEFEVQGLCYNHHARRETALLKYLLGIRIFGHFLLSMPRICLFWFTPFSQICRKNLTEGLSKNLMEIKPKKLKNFFNFSFFKTPSFA